MKCLPSSYISRIQDALFTQEGPPSLVSRIIHAELCRKYYSSREDEIRRINRERFWGAEAGWRWHRMERNWDPSFQNTYLRFRTPLIEKLRALLHQSEQFHTILEIGTGNGKFLEHLSSELSGLRSFCGVDLNKKQISENQWRYKNTSLQFFNADVLDLIQSRIEAGTIFVSCGTFEYFTEKELVEVFDAIQEKSPAIVALSEPVNIDLTKTFNSQPRGNIAWSHNYPHLLRTRGYRIAYEEVAPIDPEIPFYACAMLVALTFETATGQRGQQPVSISD